MTALAAAAYAAEHPHVRGCDHRDFGAYVRAFDSRRYLRALERAGYRWLSRKESAFPSLLGAIHDPPAGLFVRGSAKFSVLSAPAVAVVGARACSPYGAQVARMLGRELARAGLVVVSGLARGIDGEVHRGVVDGRGTTIAVLGCGVDRDYPAANRQLARDIVATGGLVVSEYAPGVEPAPWRFPARNRIVAGLCAGTIVVEARERSGALITADFALEEGREVFACPGEITSSLSAGTNALLRLGATPLTSVADVLEHYGVVAAPASEPRVTADAARVLERLADSPATADELVRATGLAAPRVAAALTELELSGLATGGDGVFRRASA